MRQLSEKPRQGFETRKTARKPGPRGCNFNVTLGLRTTVAKNGVRETYSARYYNPATGRFMSRHPLAGKSIDPNSWHKYVYAGGDPF
jgi:RHS repeat-associated protein